MFPNYCVILSAILLSLSSTTIGSNGNTWAAYSDTSSFRDVLQGRSYEDTFGDPYDSLFSSSFSEGGGGGGGGGGYGSSQSAPQERSPIRVIQQRSDADYATPIGNLRSPAAAVRSGQRASGGASYGKKRTSYTPTPQTKTRVQSRKGSYSGGGSRKTVPSKTTQQQIDNDYDNGGAGGFSGVPETGFSCDGRPYGYYADVSAGCEIFHVCQDGVKWSFFCPGGSAYHQKVQTCDWSYNVDCPASPDYYFLNERIGVLPPQDATLQRFA